MVAHNLFAIYFNCILFMHVDNAGFSVILSHYSWTLCLWMEIFYDIYVHELNFQTSNEVETTTTTNRKINNPIKLSTTVNFIVRYEVTWVLRRPPLYFQKWKCSKRKINLRNTLCTSLIHLCMCSFIECMKKWKKIYRLLTISRTKIQKILKIFAQ